MLAFSPIATDLVITMNSTQVLKNCNEQRDKLLNENSVSPFLLLGQKLN